MKKSWGVGAAVIASFALCNIAWAELGGVKTDPIKTVTCTTTQSNNGACNAILSANTAILGFKLLAGSGTSACGLYDAATLPGGSSTTGMFDELYEATAGDMDVDHWGKPYVLQTGLSIAVTGTSSVCIVYY